MSSSGWGPRAGLANRSEREGTGDRSRVSTRPAVLPFLTSHTQRRAGRPRGGPSPPPGTRPTAHACDWKDSRSTGPAPRPQEAPAGRLAGSAAPLPPPGSWGVRARPRLSRFHFYFPPLNKHIRTRFWDMRRCLGRERPQSGCWACGYGDRGRGPVAAPGHRPLGGGALWARRAEWL